MASNRGWTPLLRNAVPIRTGVNFLAMTERRMAACNKYTFAVVFGRIKVNVSGDCIFNHFIQAANLYQCPMNINARCKDK